MKKRGQVWIETVIYTLIAFVMIGLVLSFAKPKIEEIQDKAIIEQSIGMLKDINNLVLSVNKVAGNQRIIEIGIKKGELKIDGINDNIVFEIESRYAYSQPGENVFVGDIIAYTQEKGKFNTVTLTSNYSKYNITYKGTDNLKTITKSSTPYKITISNIGKDASDKVILDIDII